MYTPRVDLQQNYERHKSIQKLRQEAREKAEERLNDPFSPFKQTFRGPSCQDEVRSVVSPSHGVSIKQQIATMRSQLRPAAGKKSQSGGTKRLGEMLDYVQSGIRSLVKSRPVEEAKSPILKFKQQYDTMKRATLANRNAAAAAAAKTARPTSHPAAEIGIVQPPPRSQACASRPGVRIR